MCWQVIWVWAPRSLARDVYTQVMTFKSVHPRYICIAIVSGGCHAVSSRELHVVITVMKLCRLSVSFSEALCVCAREVICVLLSRRWPNSARLNKRVFGLLYKRKCRECVQVFQRTCNIAHVGPFPPFIALQFSVNFRHILVIVRLQYPVTDVCQLS